MGWLYGDYKVYRREYGEVIALITVKIGKNPLANK